MPKSIPIKLKTIEDFVSQLFIQLLILSSIVLRSSDSIGIISLPTILLPPLLH